MKIYAPPIFFFSVLFSLLLCGAFSAQAQQTASPAKKTNRRPVVQKLEPFEDAAVETLAKQCVKLETEAGLIELEMFPETAPATVRNFLNLTALKAYDTTTFSRIVPNFVVQGGNVSTSLKITPQLIARMQRTISDEPNPVRHERGVVSMARAAEANTATSNFFILVRDAPHLDGTFAAFGRVTSGMETVDAINKMPVIGEKPEKPVRLTRALIFPCPAIQETK